MTEGEGAMRWHGYSYYEIPHCVGMTDQVDAGSFSKRESRFRSGTSVRNDSKRKADPRLQMSRMTARGKRRIGECFYLPFDSFLQRRGSIRLDRHEMARLQLQKTKTTTLDPRGQMSRMTARGKRRIGECFYLPFAPPYKGGETMGAMRWRGYECKNKNSTLDPRSGRG